jgi:hypothetical protein
MATKKKEETAPAAAAESTSAAPPPASDAEISKPPADVVEKAHGKKVELRDKETGFYDPVTGFQVVRDQQVELGDAIGDATRVALQSGRLLIVGKK